MPLPLDELKEFSQPVTRAMGITLMASTDHPSNPRADGRMARALRNSRSPVSGRVMVVRRMKSSTLGLGRAANLRLSRPHACCNRPSIYGVLADTMPSCPSRNVTGGVRSFPRSHQ